MKTRSPATNEERQDGKPTKARRWAKVHEVKAGKNDPTKLIRKTIFIDFGSYTFLKNFGSRRKMRASEIIRRALLVFKHVRASEEDLAMFTSVAKKMDCPPEDAFHRAIGLLVSSESAELSSPADVFRRIPQDPFAVGIAPIVVSSNLDGGDEG